MLLASTRALRMAPVVVALCFATGQAARAQPDALTITQAIALAEEHSPRITSARAQLQAARAAVVTAGAYPNPELDLGLRQFRGRSDGGPSGPGQVVGFAQPIDLPSVREPRQRAAGHGLEAARFAFADVRLQLRAEVKQAFYDVLRRKAELGLFVDTERLLQEIRNRIAVRVEVGEAAKFELTRADAELASANNQSASARLRVRQAVARLRAVIGAPLGLDVDVTGELTVAPVVPTLEALRREAIVRQPALAAARAEVSRAQARLETERALRSPAPVVRASILREPQVNEFGIGVAIPLPVWNRREGPIAEALAQSQLASAAQEQIRIDVLAAADAAFSRYSVATQQIAAFEGGIIRQAEAALRVAEAAFRFGERGFIDVLDAQRVLRGVRLDFLNARFEQQSALVDIERLLASDLPVE